MALSKCPDCGQEVSTKAKSCPKCGRSLKSKKGCKVILLVFGILIVLGVIGSLSGVRSSTSRSTTNSGTNRSVSTSNTVTYSEYLQISNGMSYREVVDIIGFEGEEMSRNQLMDIETVMYMWHNRGGSNMNVTFQNDGMVLKAQFGLD